MTKRYAGQSEPAIRDLSLDLPAGEICVLVGPSGCGKTTAMRMVNRTVEITEGDILVGGTSVREHPAELRREMGYVIQQIGLFPHRTVADNIATVPKLLGWKRDRVAARTRELLDVIGRDPVRCRRSDPTDAVGSASHRRAASLYCRANRWPNPSVEARALRRRSRGAARLARGERGTRRGLSPRGESQPTGS